MNIQYFGHACFLLNNEVLIDPYLRDNPLATVSPEELHPRAILITHGHGDHVGDAVEIAERCGATVYGTLELMDSLPASIKKVGAQMCGSIKTEFGALRITSALHGSSVPGELACGFVVSMQGKKIYHAGDTGLSMEMQLLATDSIDVALLPIGDFYTMGPSDAIRAIDFIRPKAAVPMHYNTFPPIRQDPYRFKEEAEAATGVPVHVLMPGEVFEL